MLPPSYVYPQLLWLFGIFPQPAYEQEQFACHIAYSFEFQGIWLRFEQLHCELDNGATLQHPDKVSHLDSLSQGGMGSIGSECARKRDSSSAPLSG